MNYRPDIDGLRAVAVLSVIAYHIDHKLLPGGFVGVDIFFVISGYLISLHIFGEIRNDCFSLAEFYRRRVKRIAPAMLLVLFTTFILTQLFFRPEDAEETARSGFWALFPLANVYFWLFEDTTYFAAPSNEIPLLHLWSLGVEEQFYLFWPLLLMATYRRSKPAIFLIAMLVAAMASFWFGQVYFATDPSFVYYMLPARAGELLVGALAAHHVCTSTRKVLPGSLLMAASAIGTSLLLGSLFLVSPDAPFPGYQALAPTVATTLLILAGHYGRSWPTRFLQLRPMVWVGLVSYSAYLWHWPILAFLRYGRFPINAQTAIAVLFLTFLLAWLTYRYVEQPLRRSCLPLMQLALRQYALPAALIGFATLVSMKTDGYAFRSLGKDHENLIKEVKVETRPAYDFDYVCQKQRRIEAEDLDDPACIVGADSAAFPEAFLWGDSNAAHYVGMLGAFAQEAGFRFRNVEMGSCPPLRSDPAAFVTLARTENCRYSNRIVWETLEAYEAVIISANWTGYGFPSPRFLDEFEATVIALLGRGKRVILIGKVPVISGFDRLCREKEVGFPFLTCPASPIPVSEDIERVNAQVRALAGRHAGVDYYDANDQLCPDGLCQLFDESGKPVYYDTEHLTLRASWRLGTKIIKIKGVPGIFTSIGHTRD